MLPSGRRCWRTGAGPSAAGPLREAREYLEQALAMRRDREEWSRRPHGPRLESCISAWPTRAPETVEEAVDLLEAEPAGPELISAYAHLAGYQADTAAPRRPSTAAAPSAPLPLRRARPAGACVRDPFRGMARLNLGDAAGIDDLEHGLRLAIDRAWAARRA